MKKYTLLSAVVLLVFGVVSVTRPSNAFAQQKTLRFAHHHPVGSVVDITANKFAEEVNKANVGLKAQVFPAAQMGQEQENAEGCHYGTVDLTIAGNAWWKKWVPGVAFADLPFLYKDWAHVERTMGYDKPVTKAVRAALAKKTEVHLWGYLPLGFRDFAMRNEPITSIDSLKGKKMRAPEVWVWIRMYELLGAKATPITWGEVYTSLQVGVVDGFDCPAGNLVDNKFYEVTKYVTKAGVIHTPLMLIINNKVYRSLSPEQKKVADKAAEAALARGTDESKKLAAQAYKVLQEKGNVIYEMDTAPLVKAVEGMYEEFVKKEGGGRDFIDLVRSLRD
jgi:tripartite ATP-independent transporter DctP family solute receptor